MSGCKEEPKEVVPEVKVVVRPSFILNFDAGVVEDTKCKPPQSIEL